MLKIIKDSTLVPTPIVDLKLDSEPRQGSTDPVTSEGVKNAIDGAVGDASEVLQDQIDEIAEKAGSGYIPKGEASVATLNALSGQENGELYTMTDAGTLTDGSLAVVAGDTVAWDATNSVWYKAMDYAPRQYGTNEVHNLATAITAFRTGDVIPVDGPNGTAKMPKDDLQNIILIRSSSGLTDINDFNNNGIYSVDNTLANYPTGAGNGLLCVFTVGSSRKIQVLQSAASSTTSESEVWYRSGEFGSGTWAKWEKIVNDNTFNSTARNKNIFVQFNPLQNTDLNDCLNSGYYCLSSLYTWTNKPTGFSYGFMLVFTISSRTEQVAIDQLNNKFFFRSLVSGTWSNWNEIATKKYVDDEIAAVNSSIGQLDDRIDDIIVYPDNIVSLYDLPSVQVLENTNGTAAGVVNPYVNTSDVNGYRTFIYFAGSTPVELYFDSDIITNASYLSVTYGLNPTGIWESVPSSSVNEKRMYCSSSARKRKSDSNLPTSSSKLSVPSGSILIFTTASSDSVNVHINCFAELNPDIGINTPTRDKMSIKYVSSASYKIKFGDFECELYKTTNVSTDADNWNVGNITRNGETLVSKGTDIIGPIKISGDDDFIGGVHGSETTDDIYVYSGSKKLTLDSSLDESFEKLTIMMNSTCRRESDASDAFSRRICVEITRDKMHLSSEFVCISSSSLTVERVTNGGLIAAYNRDILGCYMNNYNCDGYPLTAPNNASKENAHAVIVTDLGTITVNNIKGKTEQNYKGSLALFAGEAIPRTKVYFDVFNGSKVVSNGDKFYGEAEYMFDP